MILPNKREIAMSLLDKIRKPQNDGIERPQKLSPEERLPKEAREKLRALRASVDVARAYVDAPSKRYHELREAKGRIDLRLAELRRNYALREDAPQVVEAREKLAVIERETSEAQSQLNERRGPATDAGRLLNRVERYISTAGALEPSALAEARIGKGQTIFDAIEAARDRIDDLRSQLDAARAAPLPSDEAKTIARKNIERLADLGAIDFDPCVTHGGLPIYPSFSPTRMESRTVIDAAAILHWLLKDQLIERAEKEIDLIADDDFALSTEQRHERIKTLKREILDAERLEETLLEKAAATGIPVARRPNADPRAVLGVEGPEPKE